MLLEILATQDGECRCCAHAESSGAPDDYRGRYFAGSIADGTLRFILSDDIIHESCAGLNH
jgi:hypothetical protein